VTQQSTSDTLPFVASRIAIEAETDDALTRLAENVGVTYPGAPPAWAILHYAGSLEEYLREQPMRTSPDIDWPRSDFDAASVRFRESAVDVGNVRLSRYDHPTLPTSRYLLWNGTTHQDVDRDWGRYALLHLTQKTIIAYDPRRFALLVPVGAPLPRLLARACVLCSGFFPQTVPGPRITLPIPYDSAVHVYRGIAPVVAERVAERLGQDLPLTVADSLPME
jgi:hypothetical protein